MEVIKRKKPKKMEKLIDKTDEVSFQKRLLLNCKEPLIMSVTVNILVCLWNQDFSLLNVITTLGLFFLIFMRGFYSIIYYTIEIYIKDEIIFFKYMRFNRIITDSYPISTLKIIRGRGIDISGMEIMLLIKKNVKSVFRQYVVCKWTKKRLNKIYQELANSGMKSSDYIKNSIFQ